MGFDDSLCDGQVLDKVLNALESDGSLSYYVFGNFKPAMTKEALEQCEAEDVQYHGYSVAFHMVLPVLKAFHLGVFPHTMTPFGDCGFARLRARELVLTCLLKDKSGRIEGNAAFLASVREKIATAQALQEEARKAHVLECNAHFARERKQKRQRALKE